MKNYLLMTVTTLMEVVMVVWEYRVKYGRAWWVKKHALKLIYGHVTCYEGKEPRNAFGVGPKT
jgi:hypothetical protein